MIGTPALVVVTTSFPIANDGSEAAGSFVGDIVRAIAEEGIPVRIVAPGPIEKRERWGANAEVFRYAAPDRPLSTLRPWVPTQLAQIWKVLRNGKAATLQAVASGPTAHVFALWALPSGHWSRIAARKAGVPYSVWTLGSDIWALGRIPLVRSYLRMVLAGAQSCYSDGLKLADDTRRIARRPVEFLPSTRLVERTRTAGVRSAPPYRLLFLGRWHPNKGIDLLLGALELLDAADWQRIESVEICGGGPLESVVLAGIAALRAAGHPVFVRGYLDKPAAEDAFLRADYVLIPSRIESIPVVFSDAMKLGCPVVSTPVGDLPDLVSADPQCGVVAGGATAECFASAIARATARSPLEFAEGMNLRAGQFSQVRVVTAILHGLGLSAHG